MSSLNKVTLIGNLTKDPDIRSFPNGGRVANFSIATSEHWKDKATGEKKEKTEFHRVSVTNDGLVTIIERYLKKGSKVYIEGSLSTRKWTDQATGQDKYATEVSLRPYSGQLILLSAKKSDDNETHKGMNKDGDVPQRNDDDSEIPF